MPGLRKTSRRSNKHHKNQTRVRKQSRIRKQKQKKRRTQKQNKRQKRTLKGGKAFGDLLYEQEKRNDAISKTLKKNNSTFYATLVSTLKKVLPSINIDQCKISVKFFSNSKFPLTKRDTRGIFFNNPRHFIYLSLSDTNQSYGILLWHDIYNQSEFTNFKNAWQTQRLPEQPLSYIDTDLRPIEIKNGLLITDDTKYTIDENEIKIVDGINIKRPKSKTLTLVFKDNNEKTDIIKMLDVAGISPVNPPSVNTRQERTLPESTLSDNIRKRLYALQHNYKFGPETKQKVIDSFLTLQDDKEREVNLQVFAQMLSQNTNGVFNK